RWTLDVGRWTLDVGRSMFDVRCSPSVSPLRHRSPHLVFRPMPSASLPAYYSEEILLHPENREFPPFDLVRLLGTVFEPTQGCRVCILTDFDDPAPLVKDFAFLGQPGFPVQKKAHEAFYLGLHGGAMEALGMHGGEFYAYKCTHGSNLDLSDEVWDTAGNQLSLGADIYPNYDIILC